MSICLPAFITTKPLTDICKQNILSGATVSIHYNYGNCLSLFVRLWISIFKTFYARHNWIIIHFPALGNDSDLNSSSWQVYSCECACVTYQFYIISNNILNIQCDMHSVIAWNWMQYFWDGHLNWRKAYTSILFCTIFSLLL